MDRHNNKLGISLGVDLARRAATEVISQNDARQILTQQVLDSIRNGAAVVLDAQDRPPRPSRPGDLRRPFHDAPKTLPTRGD
jgi:hypothetical protein